jgi:hypothetical protein
MKSHVGGGRKRRAAPSPETKNPSIPSIPRPRQPTTSQSHLIAIDTPPASTDRRAPLFVAPHAQGGRARRQPLERGLALIFSRIARALDASIPSRAATPTRKCRAPATAPRAVQLARDWRARAALEGEDVDSLSNHRRPRFARPRARPALARLPIARVDVVRASVACSSARPLLRAPSCLGSRPPSASGTQRKRGRTRLVAAPRPRRRRLAPRAQPPNNTRPNKRPAKTHTHTHSTRNQCS